MPKTQKNLNRKGKKRPRKDEGQSQLGVWYLGVDARPSPPEKKGKAKERARAREREKRQ